MLRDCDGRVKHEFRTAADFFEGSDLACKPLTAYP